MNIFLYFSTVLIWGSTWLAITYQLGAVPIDVSIFYRFGSASLLLFLWCFLKKKPMTFSLKSHFFFVFQGFFMFAMNYMAVYEANNYISSGLNSIGFSMVLAFNVINSLIFYRIPVTLPLSIGTICGLAGVVSMFWPAFSTFDLSDTTLLGVSISLLGGLLASFGNMISARNHRQSIPVMESNAYAMGYGALWMLPLIFWKGSPLTFDFSYPYILSLIYLSVFGSIIAFGSYLTLLGRVGASRAAYALVMVPAVALCISTIFEDFVWEPHVIFGIGLIFLGNIIILGRKLKINFSEKKLIEAKLVEKAA